MATPMKILVDQNIPGIRATFAHHGDVIEVDGRTLSREQIGQGEALIVRSVTAVNSDLLYGTRVGFVGSTTIGTDHMDIPWLERQGIRWASAPGCNADAAAQYTLAMMVLASQRLNFRLSSQMVGIVGHGNVGSRVHRMLEAYGVRRIRVCDPPLADTGRTGLYSMEELTDCGVVSFHVPLTRCGPYPTRGLAGEPFLTRLPAGALLVNTSRGKVTEKDAVQRWLASGRGNAALDVWPEEPMVDPALLEAATVATPHVAGYSLDGKLLGTQMIYLQFCDWLQTIPVRRNLLAELGITAELGDHGLTVDAAILAACPVKRDDEEMRKLAALGEKERSTRFDKLRRDYPERRDFCGWKAPGDAPPELSVMLKALGFG